MTGRQPKRAKDLGFTDVDYTALLEAQGGKCAIAFCPRTPKTRRFHVDHDHKTGYVRGLLCHWHNRIMPKDCDEAYELYYYLRRSEEAQRED